MSVLLLPLKLLLLTLDFVLMALTFGWVKALKKLLSGEPVRSVPVDSEPFHRVHPEYKGKLATKPREGVETLYDITKSAVERYADVNCMGTREFLGQHSPNVKHFGGIRWKTYAEMGRDAHKFGAALRASGVIPAPEKTTLDKITTPCSIAIFENTCSEWMLAAQGAFSQSAIVVTVYSTLGMDAVVDAINEVSVSAIVCNKINVGKLVGRVKDMKTLKTIIYTSDLVAPDAKIDLPSSPDGVKVISFEDFVASGDIAKFPATPPKTDMTAVIMYTSGSTGKPKGVVIKHSAIIAAVASGEKMLGVREGNDVYLGYLPLAHILELMAEFVFLAMGCTICYADPKTLTQTGAYPIGALEQYSPTLMAGVPKIWDIIKKGIEAKVAKSSPVARFLVQTAFQARTFAINHGYDTPLFKALVFKKFSKVVGGKLRLALSGGGPLNEEVQTFVRTCFGCPLHQGYGLTETCAGLTIQDPLDLRGGIAGQPIPSIEVKLESCPEIMDKGGLPYLTSDSRDVAGNPVHGRGEILCRGHSLSSGYYMMPDKTKEEFEEDTGFFHTGDIGQFMSDGSLRIVDRKKNLVKLKGGEYIAVENMEMTYGNSKFVDAALGGICCYGDGDMDRPIALMQINQVTSMEWAAANGVKGDFDKVKDSPELMVAVMADMKNEAKKGGLSRIEMLQAVAFLTEPWTPENGCLTAANKLQRRAVVAMFEKEFEEVRKKGIH
uniref:AMP-dependent synthetase/ligase domain-containing protein n=1 Tax=Odontella aurita TaxID=265563 RepID=A0A7S4IU95_9STRA|mmetsp:Transcript_30383/g.90621  ORF Transcript_30383/g.90621 Transcript_30383/m.90621 type:complete len:721 (+) Transcript_30383:214-2376(+)|eukprot:CAMPEP_0113599250 /NCGR_PEP_ID=MMETSP0015_2-20120614/42037_1 /TAXON_ID=2838 /ORGANISM="Odontella" /LENGTH=720 /DNA_ID=CAMNT_0000507355 /DNA_START=126 /DNA_END=2288 /DNA_ORIENTATION=+ /assembly_acc=CAM_ASM_000160